MTIRTANIVIVVMKEKNVHKVEALILPERDVPNSGEGKGNRENNRYDSKKILRIKPDFNWTVYRRV